MEIDYEYVEHLLREFLSHEKPVVCVDYFDDLIAKNNNKFFFHVEILSDKGLIKSAEKDGSLGFYYDYEEYQYTRSNWRLSADGHDFASAITKPDILAIINTKFKEEGLSVVIDIAKKIITNKAENLLNN